LNGDIITCQLNSNVTCPSGNPATSNSIAMTVNPTHPVGVTIVASANPVCAGTPVTYTATAVNGGTAPFFQWKVSGLNMGSNSSTFTYIPSNGDLVGCELASNVSCPTGNPANSNVIPMTVSPNLPVGVIITANPGAVVCAGTTVNVTASGTNGGISPAYQWKLNGINTGANSSSYSFIPVPGDALTCVYNSSETCISGNPATSNTINFTVNPNLPVSVTISDNPAGATCAGTPVDFTAAAVNGGSSPSYQWKVNGINAGTGLSVYTYMPANGDVIGCVLTSSESCTTGNPAAAIPVTKTVNPSFPVSSSITASPGIIVCPGTPVTFTDIAVNGGTIPVYQWKVNNVNAGGNSSTFTYTPAGGDAVVCAVTSNLNCPIGNPALSNTLNISQLPAPTVSLVPCGDVITNTGAQPFKLKGGLPLGGTYSGPGVNSVTGVFTPSAAGVGVHSINYSYTNAGFCTIVAAMPVTVLAATPFTCGSLLTDPRDNQTYPTTLIGTQCWLAGNLNYGTMIASPSMQVDNCTTEKYCPNNQASYCATQGGFYQWDELMAHDPAAGAQGLCPPGWHVPTTAEWLAMMNQVNQQSQAGYQLKDPAPGGFNALLNGVLYQNNTWTFVPPAVSATFFWTSDAVGATRAMSHALNSIDQSVSDYASSRANAMNARCVKD
jgi:uncharacterized protein (TIGR02145 family)